MRITLKAVISKTELFVNRFYLFTIRLRRSYIITIYPVVVK